MGQVRSEEGPGQARTVAAVELVVEDLLGVLLGLLGGVGVVEVGLVATGDLTISRHGDGWTLDGLAWLFERLRSAVYQVLSIRLRLLVYICSR